MTIKDAWGLVSTGDISEDKTDFQNALALGIDFSHADWDTIFITKCIASGKGFPHALCVISFLRGAKLGAHGIMSKNRALWLEGFTMALHYIKFGEIELGETTSIK